MAPRVLFCRRGGVRSHVPPALWELSSSSPWQVSPERVSSRATQPVSCEQGSSVAVAYLPAVVAKELKGPALVASCRNRCSVGGAATSLAAWAA